MLQKIPRYVVDLVKMSMGRETSHGACTLADNRVSMFEVVKQASRESNLSYKTTSDKHRRKQVFDMGDEVIVFLRKEGLPTSKHGKLKRNYYRPFKILKKINDNSYVVDSLDNMGNSKTFTWHI